MVVVQKEEGAKEQEGGERWRDGGERKLFFTVGGSVVGWSDGRGRSVGRSVSRASVNRSIDRYIDRSIDRRRSKQRESEGEGRREKERLFTVRWLFLDCLVLRVHVQVPLHGPEVLVVVPSGRQHLEADVAERVEHHYAGALEADAVLRVPAVLVLHVLGELAL